MPLTGALHCNSNEERILNLSIGRKLAANLFQTLHGYRIRPRAFERRWQALEIDRKKVCLSGVVGTQLNATEPLIGARKGCEQAVGRSWTGRQQVTEHL